jgi:hypothetical protein
MSSSSFFQRSVAKSEKDRPTLVFFSVFSGDLVASMGSIMLGTRVSVGSTIGTVGGRVVGGGLVGGGSVESGVSSGTMVMTGLDGLVVWVALALLDLTGPDEFGQ